MEPQSFEKENHFYPRVLNAQLHWSVRSFMKMNLEQILVRFCHLHPEVDEVRLRRVLSTPPKHLRWAGCDLISCTDACGRKSMIVIETNSCPSGMKSTPLFEESDEMGGYRRLLEYTLLPMLPEAERRVPGGGLAVLYDKNAMETWGYACALAQLTNEPVHLVPLMMEEASSGDWGRARFNQGVLEVRDDHGAWVRIRAALRYVTQRPWDRIPVDTHTLLLNPIVGCLAGGRNKGVAAKAYAWFNEELTREGVGIRIQTPYTETDVPPHRLRERVTALGGYAVVKVPYSNAGQGVFTITNQDELRALEDRIAGQGMRYERFVVQSLISGKGWSSTTNEGTLYHVGTMPTPKRREIYVADLRLMLAGGGRGFKVVGVYGRKARKPLTNKLEPGADSWSMLGTNLSVKVDEGLFSSESERLILADCRDFDQMGLGIDDLVEAYVQTCLSITAVDRMCEELTPGGRFSIRRFEEVNDDPGLLAELMKDEDATCAMCADA